MRILQLVGCLLTIDSLRAESQAGAKRIVGFISLANYHAATRSHNAPASTCAEALEERPVYSGDGIASGQKQRLLARKRKLEWTPIRRCDKFQ